MVGEDEVLAAVSPTSLRYDFVAVDVLRDALPHHPEHVGRTGEWMPAAPDDLALRLSGVGHPGLKLTPRRWQAGLLSHLEDLPRRHEAASAGFHTTVLPISARCHRQFSGDRVKLNGFSANVKPSRAPVSVMFHTPGPTPALTL